MNVVCDSFVMFCLDFHMYWLVSVMLLWSKVIVVNKLDLS